MTKQFPKAIALLLAFSVVMAGVATFGWGNDGHTEVNLVAAQKIPNSMPAFLRTRSARDRIAYLGPEPDRWRGAAEYALNNAQSPDHYINLELIEDLGTLPKGRYEFYQLLYGKRAAAKNNPDQYLPEHVGMQPYITIEIFERLKAAFRDYRRLIAARKPAKAVEQDIIFYAGWLGHYVGDGSQPLHTTIQHDGWTGANPGGFTTERGIHWRFENDFVARNIQARDFADTVRSSSRLADPFADYMKYLEDSHALVVRVYELDKAKGFDGAGSPEALQFTKERLAAGSQMLLDLWYTAWLESGEQNQVPAKKP